MPSRSTRVDRYSLAAELSVAASSSSVRASGSRLIPAAVRTMFPARAVEQFHAERMFEPLDLLADHGLRQKQAVRRPPEVQFLGDGDEDAHLPQLKISHAESYLSVPICLSVFDDYFLTIADNR
jgi:hypothetical protein